MAVEAFDLGEKAHAERIAIEQTDGVVRVHGGDQPVAAVANGVQMARRNESGHANDGEVLGQRCSPDACTRASDGRLRASAAPITAATRGPLTCSEYRS